MGRAVPIRLPSIKWGSGAQKQLGWTRSTEGAEGQEEGCAESDSAVAVFLYCHPLIMSSSAEGLMNQGAEKIAQVLCLQGIF